MLTHKIECCDCYCLCCTIWRGLYIVYYRGFYYIFLLFHVFLKQKKEPQPFQVVILHQSICWSSNPYISCSITISKI